MDYHIKYQKRKSIRIEVTSNYQLLVKAPYRTPNDVIEGLIEKNREWIEKRLQTIQNQQTKSVVDEPFHYIGGDKYLVTTSDELTGLIQVVDKEVRFSTKADQALVKQELRKVQLAAFQPLMESLFIKYSNEMGLSFSKVTVKNMKSRWGSCSNKGNISINVRLALAPKEVLRYIIIHELAHLKHMHHQEAFWLLVSKFDEEYNKHRNWLKTNGHLLIWN